MHSNTLTTLTGQQPYGKDTDINTFTIQYVDDSTNMISSKDINLLQAYINSFFLLLESYYNINKLALNQHKSKFLLVCKGSMRERAKNVKLKTSNFTIEQSQKVKILGMYILASLSNIHNANNLVSKNNYRLITLKKVTKYADMRTSKMIANAIILSVFKYSCPLMINSDIIILNKVN